MSYASRFVSADEFNEFMKTNNHIGYQEALGTRLFEYLNTCKDRHEAYRLLKWYQAVRRCPVIKRNERTETLILLDDKVEHAIRERVE